MHCPKCKEKIKTDDMKIEIYGSEAMVIINCPECFWEYLMGFSQSDLDDAADQWAVRLIQHSLASDGVK